MSDRTDAYQAALRKYKASETEATSAVKLIHKLSDTLAGHDSFTSFLGWRLNIIQDHSRRLQDGGNIDWDQWPDKAKISGLLLSWHGALQELRAVWNALSAEEREGFSEPPSQLSPIGRR